MLGQREGRATGDCYVQFSTPAEAQRAMVMNNKHMVHSPTIRDARDPLPPPNPLRELSGPLSRSTAPPTCLPMPTPA